MTIKNEHQYQVTKAQAERFAQTLLELEYEAPIAGRHLKVLQLQIESLRSQIYELNVQIAEYESLRSGDR